ncbi:MAG: hypothetical protein Edafosvirus39_3 [Edafosvirus sp.]|uniref:Uncharacterized protein n=1 Tax=Edafosvirus sp. TaxID=2487765 RepID=A0A3G4ZVF0_9VIRU|nr:MAG: hypothetical protein Edafosvirus39_3 [Edafosvirus sp.]
MTSIVPKKLAIYYGIPSLVNNSNSSITSAVNTFKQYDLLVLGDGPEVPSHQDHNNTISIINDANMINTQVYGYIDSTISISSFTTKVSQWKAMGNVKGIFCDRFGYDFNVTRTKQNSILNLVHSNNLKAFVDAWNPDDVFSSQIQNPNNLTGTATVIKNTDIYLAQSYQIINGDYQDPTFWKAKADKMQSYKQTFGTLMACVTTYDTRAYDQTKADYAYYSCILYNFDSWGFGEYLYSAPSSLLPFRPRKDVLGTKFVNDITLPAGGVYDRNVNIGIHIDTYTHTVSNVTS